MSTVTSKGDNQPKSNPALERLNVLVGEWDVEMTEMSFHPDPFAVARAHTSFNWIERGAFVLQHFGDPDSDFPGAMSIIGPDDNAETYCMLYFDGRGVSRIYQMSFSTDTWRLWREFPGFSQRFIANFSDDRNVMNARWEKSSNGSTWELDFNLKYTRVQPTRA